MKLNTNEKFCAENRTCNGQVNNAVAKFDRSLQDLMTAMAPTCAQMVLKCELGTDRVMDGQTCCSQLFNPTPVFTHAGTTT